MCLIVRTRGPNASSARRADIVIARSNTPEFGAGRLATFNEVFGRTRNPWNTALTLGGSTGRRQLRGARCGRRGLACPRLRRPRGSLRRPATYRSVVRLAASSPGRITAAEDIEIICSRRCRCRGGRWRRNVADVALFLDTMAGLCPRDPLTFDAPHRSFTAAVASPVAPKRVAYTADFGGKVPVDRETREICAAAARRFEDLGAVVEEAAPDLGNIGQAFLALRSQHFVVGAAN